MTPETTPALSEEKANEYYNLRAELESEQQATGFYSDEFLAWYEDSYPGDYANLTTCLNADQSSDELDAAISHLNSMLGLEASAEQVKPTEPAKVKVEVAPIRGDIAFVAEELRKYQTQTNYPIPFLEAYQKEHPTDFTALSNALASKYEPHIDAAIVDLDIRLGEYFKSQDIVARAGTEKTPESYEAFLDHNGLPKISHLEEWVGKFLSQNPTVQPLEWGDKKEFGKNGYSCRLEFSDKGQVTVTLSGVSTMTPGARSLYDKYVTSVTEALNAIPGYSVGRGLLSSQKERGLIAITVGLPNVMTWQEAKDGGYLVKSGDDWLPAEGYDWVDKDSEENWAVRPITPYTALAPNPEDIEAGAAAIEGALAGAPEGNPEAPKDYRADAREHPEKYLTETAGDTSTFTPPDDKANRDIRIEDLYEKDTEKPNLTSTRYPGMEFAYGDGAQGKSWYDVKGSGQRLAILKGDSFSEVKKEEAPALVATNETPGEKPAIVTSAETAPDEATLRIKAEELAQIHTEYEALLARDAELARQEAAALAARNAVVEGDKDFLETRRSQAKDVIDAQATYAAALAALEPQKKALAADYQTLMPALESIDPALFEGKAGYETALAYAQGLAPYKDSTAERIAKLDSSLVKPAEAIPAKTGKPDSAVTDAEPTEEAPKEEADSAA